MITGLIYIEISPGNLSFFCVSFVCLFSFMEKLNGNFKKIEIVEIQLNFPWIDAHFAWC